jgi:hypothetical protein
MERKERNAEGKTSACQIPSFISAMFYKIFTKKVYISNVITLMGSYNTLTLLPVPQKKMVRKTYF